MQTGEATRQVAEQALLAGAVLRLGQGQGPTHVGWGVGRGVATSVAQGLVRVRALGSKGDMQVTSCQ